MTVAVVVDEAGVAAEVGSMTEHLVVETVAGVVVEAQ